MGWAALFRRPPILRGVSASHIRADRAVNQARIIAHYGLVPPSSPQLRGEADAAHHSDVISHCSMHASIWAFEVEGLGSSSQAKIGRWHQTQKNRFGGCTVRELQPIAER